jgi:hypothetical protein
MPTSISLNMPQIARKAAKQNPHLFFERQGNLYIRFDKICIVGENGFVAVQFMLKGEAVKTQKIDGMPAFVGELTIDQLIGGAMSNLETT